MFTDSEMKSKIQEKDTNGNTILHLICQNRKRERVLDDFFKVAKDVLDAEELKDFLKTSNSHGSNCLLLVVKCRNKSMIKALFEIIRAELSIDDQREVIQKHDNDSNNIFSCTNHNSPHENSSIVKDFAKEILTEVQFEELMQHAELRSDFLSSTDSETSSETESNYESSNCTTDEELLI